MDGGEDDEEAEGGEGRSHLVRLGASYLQVIFFKDM